MASRKRTHRPLFSAGAPIKGAAGYWTSTVKKGGRIVMRNTAKWSRQDALASARRIARQLNGRPRWHV